MSYRLNRCIPALLLALTAGLSFSTHAQTGEAIKMTSLKKKAAEPKIVSLSYTPSKIAYKPIGGAGLFPKATMAQATLITSGGPCNYSVSDPTRSYEGSATSNSTQVVTYLPEPGTYKITVKGSDSAQGGFPSCQGEATAAISVVMPRQ